jgi:WD40 repeat protein
VPSIAVRPDGRHLVSGDEDTTIRIWDLVTGKEVQRLNGHAGIVRSVAIALDGRPLVSGDEQGTVRLWELA